MKEYLINLPISYQKEGILKGKRKPNIYDFVEYVPVEVRSISNKDVNLVALYEEKNIVKPYIEYDGELYEPLNIFDKRCKLIDTKKIDGDITSILFNIGEKLNIDKDYFLNVDVIQGLDVEDYQKMLQNKEIFLSDIDKDTSLKEFNETFSFDNWSNNDDGYLNFRTILSSNEKIKIKNAQTYADNLLLIDGKIFIKSIGPTFKQNNNYEQISISHPSVTNNKHINSRMQKTNNMISLYYSFPYALFSVLKNENEDLLNNNIREQIFKTNQVFVFEPFMLYETTKQYLGEYFFNQAFGNLQQTIDHKYEVNSTHPERKLETWFQHLKQDYTFGEKLVNKYYDCFKSNFDINVVYDAIKTFFLYEKHFSTDSVLLIDMQKYLEPNASFLLRNNCKITRPSDREIINDAVKTYKQFKENILLSINNYNNTLPTVIINDFKSNVDISECVQNTQALDDFINLK